MKSILVIGKNGQVGAALPQALRPLGQVTALGRDAVDLTDPDAIRAAIRTARPDVIVNAAAYTAVDKAESEPELAMQVNAVAPGVIAEESARLGALLVHYSTDYVFDGTKPEPYVETDTPNPLSAYGRSKLAGEQAIRATSVAHYILRTSWVYSAGGANFLNTVLRLGRERLELRVVNDQIGAPTWATAIASMTAHIVKHAVGHPVDPHYGVYHLTASGAVTWFGFAQAIFAQAEQVLGIKAPRLVPITTAEYPMPAQRPANSCLETGKISAAFGIRPDAWLMMLNGCVKEKAVQAAAARA